MDNNEHDTKKKLSTKDFVLICMGIVFLSLIIVAATGQTYVGSFLTCIFAFVFGAFYPALLAIFGFLSIYLIAKHSAFKIGGSVLGIIGFWLMMLCIIALCSYEYSSTTFSNFSAEYSSTFSNYASSFASIDNPSYLTTLGGGWIGGFLFTLFASFMSKAGAVSLFVILLIIGLGMLSAMPIYHFVMYIKKKNSEKVVYTSPYQTDRKKKRASEDVSSDNILSSDEENYNNIRNNSNVTPVRKSEDNYESKLVPSSSAAKKGTEKREKEKAAQEAALQARQNAAKQPADDEENPQSTLRASNTKKASPQTAPEMTETVAEETVIPSAEQSAPLPEPVPVYEYEYEEEEEEEEEEEVEEPYVEPSKPEAEKEYSQASETGQRENTGNARSYSKPKVEYVHRNPQPEPEPEPEEEEEEESQPFIDSDAILRQQREQASIRARESLEKSKQQVDFMVPEEPETETEPEAPVQRQSQTRQSQTQKPPVVIVQNYVTAPEPQPTPSPAQYPEEPEPEEEEEEEDIFGEVDEALIEQQYFDMKRRKQEEVLAARKAQEDARMAEVYKYVSKTERYYDYQLPDDGMLEDRDDSGKLIENNESAVEKAKIINQVFKDFKMPARATSYTIGASVTRFNIEADPGFKRSKITSVLDELQIALNGDKSVRIETVVEGKNTSGIEIGNFKPMAVSFRECFQEIELHPESNLLLPIGKDISGNIVTYPLDDMPHLLVAGTTGSGKSVLVHSFIMTLIMRNYPSQMKLMLIDPKQVEFAKYNLEPHLYCPVISDANAAITALQKLCVEMDRRYSVLKQYGCVKMSEYRSKRRGNERDMENIPDIVCVIDEFADLMQTGGNEVAETVQRIAQKARAAGIYLIIATQRPSKDVIPMVIKANIACRIGLSCSTGVDSTVILDEYGAETLLGKGDLLFKCPGKKSLIRAQSPYISNDEIDKVLDYVKSKAGDPCYDPEFLDLEPRDEESFVSKVPTNDEIYEDVKDFVMKTGIISKSAIMRNFSLSYAKTDQFIARLKTEGIVQTMAGGKNVVVKRMAMEE